MHHRFFIRNPESSLNWTAYTDPLADEVWIVIAVLTLFTPLLLWLAVRHGGGDGHGDDRQFLLYRAYIFVAGAIAFARPYSVVPRTTLAKAIFLTVCLSGSMIFWHWEAMLISFLAVKTLTFPFTDIESLMADTQFK